MLLAGLWLAGCAPGVTPPVLTCTVEGALDESEGAPGDEIVVTGGPFSEAFDTTVRVAGFPADVLSVERTDCAFCDECIDASTCSSCTQCDACDDLCDLCVETTTFVVPDVEAGATSVVLVNRWGSTVALPFTVLGDGDTDDTDGGDTDTGIPDTDTDAPDTDGGTADTDTGSSPPARSAPRHAKPTPAVYRPAAEFLVCPSS